MTQDISAERMMPDARVDQHNGHAVRNPGLKRRPSACAVFPRGHCQCVFRVEVGDLALLIRPDRAFHCSMVGGGLTSWSPHDCSSRLDSEPCMIRAACSARKVGKHRRVRVYDFNAFARSEQAARACTAADLSRESQALGEYDSLRPMAETAWDALKRGIHTRRA